MEQMASVGTEASHPALAPAKFDTNHRNTNPGVLEVSRTLCGPEWDCEFVCSRYYCSVQAACKGLLHPKPSTPFGSLRLTNGVSARNFILPPLPLTLDPQPLTDCGGGHAFRGGCDGAQC